MYYNQNSPDIYNKKNLLGQYKLSLFMTLFQFLCLQILEGILSTIFGVLTTHIQF